MQTLTLTEIIRMRNIVANEWKDLMTQVDNDHIRVRQAVFTQQCKSTQQQEIQDQHKEDGEELLAFQ